MAASRGRADGSAGAATVGAALEGIVERERIVERLVENAPEELRRRRQWVVRKGKIPYNAKTGAAASSTDSETWSTFDEAVRAFEGGGYDGVGFVFGSGDPYAGIDLDKCRDPETGELKAWAQEIVDDLGGYAELSPSGTGVHVIVRGKAPNKKLGRVEAYSVERYFTVTGEALKGAGVPIPERQAELDTLTHKCSAGPEPGDVTGNGHGHHAPPARAELSDGEVIERCRKAKNAPKFSALYDAGDTSAYDGDDSDADLGLLGILKFYTQDPLQLERIFGGSALGRRRKWRERPDYRRGTIDKALQSLAETYAPPHSRSHSLGSTGTRNNGNEDLKRSIQALSFSGREKPAPRGWIVENHVWEDHATSWFGEGGVAKSLLALHLGLTVAAESRSCWMAFAVKTVPVLYLDFELDADEQHRRALDLAAGMGLTGIPENFYYLPVAMMRPEEAFKIAAEECCRLGVKLVIVDSVGFALEGDSESARDVLGFYRKCVQPLKDAGASPLLIDHQAKITKGEKYSDKQAFGSVYKTNAVRSSFQIRGSHDQGQLTATFTHKKNNFGRKERDFSLKAVFEEGCIAVELLEAAMPNPDREPSKKESVSRAVEELGRATAETVQNKTGISLKTVRNCISDLLKEGALQDTGEKRNRSRIVVPRSRTTEGTGAGTKGEGGVLRENEPEAHPSACLCEECLPV